jgi:PLP dependent protein
MVSENVQNIRARIRDTCIRTGRRPEDVTLIAVTKTFGPEQIREAIQSGLLDIGENYVQEAAEKRRAVPDPEIRWHYIGHLQSNKVKSILPWVSLIHSVDSVSLAAEIQKRAEKFGQTVEVLIEVNTSEEASKYGTRPDRTLALVSEVAALPNIRLKGMMTIGPFDPDPEVSRPAFRLLKGLLNEANASNIVREPLRELSMGMTHDFEVAIEEGATMVRIGTAIFGTRKKSGVSL